MKLSVLLASLNGERFIEFQVRSILTELETGDELIISDDGSQDATVSIIEGINDCRIKLIKGPSKGINKNFLNALKSSEGDLVMFSDQDDLWLPGRVKFFKEKLKNFDFVFCDAEIIDENGKLLHNSYFKKYQTKKTFLGNLLMCRTLGCCIGFRREVLGDKFKFVDDYHKLPFDYSITLFALAYFNCFFSSKAFHQYRRHNLNISSGGAKSTNSFFKMLIFRLRVLVFVLNAFPEHFLKRKAKFFLGDSH